MDTVLLAKIILFALIAASIVGAAVCWQQRKFAMTALLGLLVIPSVVGLVKWSMPTIPDGLPNQPQPWTSPAAMTLATLQPFRPAEKTAAGYQSSDACKECHAANHESWHASYLHEVWYTQVSVFGISCEACHGPGDKHIALHRQSESVANDPIVNPADLSSKASSQVCGQCHSVHSNLENAAVVQNNGHGFRPGDDLNETHEIWQRDSEVASVTV